MTLKNRCICFCTAQSYDLTGLHKFFSEKNYEARLLKDVLHVSNKKLGDIFFFSYGALVIWGYKKTFEDKLVRGVQAYSTRPLKKIESDQFYFYYSDETKIEAKENSTFDFIILKRGESNLKLAISHGLSQSVKLEAFEETIQESIEKNAYLPEEMASKGVISLSRRAIFQRVGEIFLVRSLINLNSEYLDTPEFFWRNPLLEPYYYLTKKFLDIPSRVMALNQKLDVLQELLDILNNQVQHHHSSMLEIVIIILITAEIIISIIQMNYS